MAERERFPWGGMLVGFLILVILVAVVGTPMLLKSRREARLREMMNDFKTLSTAQYDFRSNDRDGNKVNDFWTGDVAGLHTLRSAKDGSEIRLIDSKLAVADSAPLLPLSLQADPRDGYWFKALDQDNAVRGDPDWIYRMDTDGSGRKVHSLSKYGICAFPTFIEPGRPIFIVNENHTVFHRSDGKLHFNWPDDYELKYNYSISDY